MDQGPVRRIVHVVVILALCAPVAWARDKRHHRDEAMPPIAGDSSQLQGKGRKDAKDGDPAEPETAEQRAARLSRALRSKDTDEVRAALDELHRLETAAARDLLVDFVKSTRDDRLKADGILALGWRGNRAAVEFLSGRHGATSSRSRIAGAGCRALGAVGDPSARPLLLERLRADGAADDIVAGALAGLVALDVKAADLPALLRLYVAHESAAVRCEVAVALAEVDTTDWHERLVAFAADADPGVRAAACDALGERKDEDAIGVLMRLQKDDPEKAVREAALRAMLRIDDAAGD